MSIQNKKRPFSHVDQDASMDEAFEAIRRSDLERLEQIYRTKTTTFNIKAKNRSDESLLYAAVIARNTDIIALLLYLGADPNEIHPCKDGQTPIDRLYTYVSSDITIHNREICHLQMCLLDERINANEPLAKYLLDRNINTQNYPVQYGDSYLILSNKTPLMSAAQNRNYYAVKYLLHKRGAVVTPEITDLGTTAIIFALISLKKSTNEKDSEKSRLIIETLMHFGADLMEVPDEMPILRDSLDETLKRIRERYHQSQFSQKRLLLRHQF